jgi:hypothetical protein
VSGSNPKRNHHILPALYLKGFATAPTEPFLWVYKRGYEYCRTDRERDGNPYKQSIRRLGSRDFYAYPTETGTYDFEATKTSWNSLKNQLIKSFTSSALSN